MKLTSPALLVLSLAFGVASAARLQASSSREKLSIVMNGPADRSSTSQARPHDAHPHDAGRVLKEETALTTAIDDGTVAMCGQCEDTSDCMVGHLCVTAADSGCFNFDVSGTYCAPVYIPADSVSSVGDPGEGTDGAIDVSEVDMVGVETPSEPTFAPSVGGTTVEPTAAPTVPLCGQCKNADDCLPAYACVSATASGCFNFDVAGDDKLYCVPASTTDGPTVAVTEETTTAGPTVAPTVAGTTAEPTVAVTEETTTVEPTVAPTVAATTAEPTAAPTLTSTDSATTLEPTPPPTYATIRWIGGDPSITLQACEGDCDDGEFSF